MPAAEDPAYQAYLRALGFDRDIAREDAALQTTQAQAQAQLAKPEVMAQGEWSREGISDSFEDRGFYMSSERLRSLANQRRAEAYQLALIDKGAADAVADIGMGLRREIAGIDRQQLSAQQAHDAYLRAQQDPELAAMDLVTVGRQTQQAGLRPTAPRGRFG